MNERAGNGRRNLRVRTHVRRERTTDGGGRRPRGSRTGAGARGTRREKEGGERTRRVSAWPYARALARKHESVWFLARAEAHRGNRARSGPPARSAGKARRDLKSVSERRTCRDAGSLVTNDDDSRRNLIVSQKPAVCIHKSGDDSAGRCDDL